MWPCWPLALLDGLFDDVLWCESSLLLNMSRVDCVVVIQWWWCDLDGDGVLGCWCWWCGDAVLGRLWSLAEQVSPPWCFYTWSCDLGVWHLSACIWWLCYCELPCPSRLAWDISTRALVIRSTFWWLSIVACYFCECHLVNVILANCCFLYLVAGAKIRKEEKKERNKTFSFLLEFYNL
jgi:hypothetical protein